MQCANPAIRFDIIWVDPYPYDDGVTEMLSENCPGLDS